MGDRETLPSFAKTVAIFCALMAFASISTDLYLCLLATPTLGQSLGGSQSSVELTLSGLLIGLGIIGQMLLNRLNTRFVVRKVRLKEPTCLDHGQSDWIIVCDPKDRHLVG